MDGMRLLHKLRLTNFLSYGPEGTEIELQPLNVLIGPNGSGKSNLIEAVSLLKAAPSDISVPIRAGGGIPQWFWKGGGASRSFEVFAEAAPVPRLSPDSGVRFQWPPMRHLMQVEAFAQQAWIVAERIEEARGETSSFDSLYSWQYGPEQKCLLYGQQVDPKRFDHGQSIFAQIKEPLQYASLTKLGRSYEDICLFRDSNLGPSSPIRGEQRADAPASFLMSDGRNLGMVLNHLLNQPVTKKLLIDNMKRFYDRVEDIRSRVYANIVETFLHERGFSDPTPSVRLSDGTLRYLCLLTILCHPEPPPLVCIEDPEVGLHPDILPIVADLLLEASERMQLIVTTHSDILVSAFSHVPEAVVVCERDDAGSHLQRLDPDRLKEWLKKYSLGEYWVIGGLGGVT